MSTSESDKIIGSHKLTTTTAPFAMDLAPKMALVKQNDKGITTVPVQPHQTFRATIGQQQMRVVAVPAGTVQTSNIIQTHIMPQAMLKQVDTSNRTIQTVPARSITQTSITVSRPLTPVSYLPRCQTTVTNIHTARGAMSTPIRNSTQSSATVANITPTFVRATVPPRTSSPATTVLAQGTTWMPGASSVQVQLPAHLIRGSIGQTTRSTRVVTATSSNNATITANVLTSQQAAQIVPQQTLQQSVSGTQGSGPSQTFVATLATVLPPRPQTATLVYSNNVTHAQQYNTGTVQKLPVATTIGPQRQVRPIQRLPTTNVRVSTASISIRAPNVPVLAPTSVLTSIPNAGQTRTVTGSGNVVSTNNTIPTRIIQVQPQSGRIQAMTLPQNIVINATRNMKQIQPSLTISHVGKIGQQSSATLSVNNSGIVTSGTNVISTNNLITPNTSITTHTPVSSFGSLQQHLQSGPNNTTIVSGTIQGHIQQQNQQSQQLAQLVSVNSANQTHQLVTVSQHQLLPSQNQSGTTTVVPLSSITRNANTAHIPVNVTTLSSQSSHIPVNVSTISAQNQTNTINIVSSSTGNTATLVNVLRSVSSATSGGGTTTITTIPPIAKVLPQQQHITNEILHHHQQQSHHLQHNSPQLHTAGGTPIYIHARTPNPGTVSNTIQTSTIGTTSTTTGTIIPTNATTFIPASGTIPYASSTSSFAVVPTSNRSIGTIHGIIPTIGSNQLQTVPVRFNPLIVDHLPNSNVATVKAVGGNVINVIPSALQVSSSNNNTNTGTLQTSTQHVAIPKIIATISSPRPSILRKRDNEGSPIKGRQAVTSALVSLANAVTSNCGNTSQVIQFNELIEMRDQRESSPTSRPGSTDGSTTVSATSSPGLDQQEQEEQDLAFNNRLKTEFKFKTVEELVPSQAQTQLPQLTAQALSQHQLQQQLSTISSSNGDVTPRKKARKQQLTNENTNSLNIQYTNNNNNNNGTNIAENTSTSLNLSGGSVTMGQELNESNYLQNKHNNNAKSKESLPTEITVKKPQTVSLLQCYKQNWKAANNHFQRYSDIRPRDERRPSVMDLANQAHVLQKVNGWKVYHLSAQIEDLCELESQAYDKLALMLESMEAHEPSSDIERVNDLLKGNMQRSKIIIDGINDARSQILKIFDHKPNVSDIIQRCASKRNFKKREKNTNS